MQEFNLSLTDALTKGLRPKSYNKRNSDFLQECKYLKVTEQGLIEDDGVTNPFISDPYASWPFPQFIRGQGVNMLAGETTLETVDEDSWGTVNIETFDYASCSTPKAIVAGGPWHYADFYETWFLLNGSCVVFKDKSRSMFGEADKVLVCDERTINTGCDFKGRVIFAGFDPTDFWDVEWQALMAYWGSRFDYDLSYVLTMGSNFVWWSAIGGGNALDLFYPERAVYGVMEEDADTAVSAPMYLEYMKRNDSGFMPMPWQGTVLCTKPLGKGVMVYGDNGIAFMYPASGGGVATMGLEKLADFGIASRSAVGGNFNSHLFVDTSGALWRVGKDVVLQKLDYNEYVAPLLDSEIVVTHNPHEEDFYVSGTISDTETGFLLTPSGLSATPYAVTSGYFMEGAFVGVRKVADDTEVLVTVDTQDMGYREDKTITTVEIGLDTSSDVDLGFVEVAADYRYSKSGEWVTTPWVVVNDKGWERLQITATEMRLKIRIGGYSNVRIDELNIRWQMSNKQTIRGLSAAKIG